MPCPNDCSYNGLCDFVTNICSCNIGSDLEDCSRTLATEFPNAWAAWRGLFIILFSTELAFALGVFVVVRRRKLALDNEASLHSFSSKNLTLILAMVLCGAALLFPAVDPYHTTGYTPQWALWLSAWLKFPVFLTVFTAILYNWAVVYHNTLAILKKAEMLQKINQKYQSNITLEDVIKQMQFMNKFKVPVIIINSIGYFLYVLMLVLVVADFGYTPRLLLASLSIYLYVCFLGITIGFVIYGKKLIGLLPSILRKKMAKVQKITIACCLLFIAVMTIVFTMGEIGLGGIMIMYFVFELMLNIIAAVIISTYVKVRPRFPFVHVVGTINTDRDDSNEISTGSKAASV